MASSINTILRAIDHRPWSLPTSKWKYYQEWNRAVFLHWQVNILELQKFIPLGLEIDLFEGKAWVSIVAFSMEKIRPRILPAFSPISYFDEINIRTYVKHKNKSGVYFLSIEAGNIVSAKLAKTLSGLPYRYSTMNRAEGKYESSNSRFSDQLSLKYGIGEELKQKSDLDIWLTERYALFQENGASLNEFNIHHLEWPLFQLNLNELNLSYPRFEKLFVGKPKLTHYSPGVQVLAWEKKYYPVTAVTETLSLSFSRLFDAVENNEFDKERDLEIATRVLNAHRDWDDSIVEIDTLGEFIYVLEYRMNAKTTKYNLQKLLKKFNSIGKNSWNAESVCYLLEIFELSEETELKTIFQHLAKKVKRN